MSLRKQRTLCIEIRKTLNKLNPGYMNDNFKLRNTDRPTREKYVNDTWKFQNPIKPLLEQKA